MNGGGNPRRVCIMIFGVLNFPMKLRTALVRHRSLQFSFLLASSSRGYGEVSTRGYDIRPHLPTLAEPHVALTSNVEVAMPKVAEMPPAIAVGCDPRLDCRSPRTARKIAKLRGSRITGHVIETAWQLTLGVGGYGTYTCLFPPSEGQSSVVVGDSGPGLKKVPVAKRAAENISWR